MADPGVSQDASIYVQVTAQGKREQDVFIWKQDADNSWICPTLAEHFVTYGTVTSVWAPWKEQDQRNFARVSFTDKQAAEKAVSAYRHLIEGTECIAVFQRPQKGQGGYHVDRPKMQPPHMQAFQEDSEGDGAVEQFLKEMLQESYHELTWDNYYAPRDKEEELWRIGDDLNPKLLQQKQALREEWHRSASKQAPGIPIVVFEGPPGSGKTFAMKVLAAQSGLKAWQLKTQGLQSGWQSETRFEKILHRIENLEKALVCIDECEVLFPRREVMGGYQSVDVRTHQKMIGVFLQWAEGLNTKKFPEGQVPPVICLATNLKQNMDEAVLDRARSILSFASPTPSQCAKFWSDHALQLSKDSKGDAIVFPHLVLGCVSWAAGLSFRNMWSIADSMLHMAAKRIVERPGGVDEGVLAIGTGIGLPCECWRLDIEGLHACEPSLGDYVKEILGHKRQQLPPASEVARVLYRWTWALHNITYLADRARWPRARL